MIHDGGGLLRLTKHEGAGNDFLVVTDTAGRDPLGPATVRALCDRRRGVGADGLIWVGPGREGAPVSMLLRNADGSEAEMSGNGIRCLAQAAVDAGLVAPPRFAVATGAGRRTVDYLEAEGPGVAWASVDMGAARVTDEVDPPAGFARAAAVSVGNPHLVVLATSPAALGEAVLDLPALAAELSATRPAGVNVEVIAPAAHPDELVLRVYERGAGETLACGTGSVAAVAATRAWGLTGPRAVVHNPGGPLEVTLGASPGAPAYLAGPVRKIAELVVDLGAFA